MAENEDPEHRVGEVGEERADEAAQSRAPKKRFVGRRQAAQLAGMGNGNSTAIEESSAIQGITS
jgi:hypothetical protein